MKWMNMKTPAQFTVENRLAKNLCHHQWLACLTMLLMCSLSSALRADDTPMVKTQAMGFYRMMIGDFELTAFSDGTSPKDIASIMSDPAKVRAEFEAMHLMMPYQSSYNVYLINTGKKLIMIDSGRGGNVGQYAANLRESGYQPEQVDAVLITHMHGDHVGGLSLDDKRQFPNATVYSSKQESDFWLNLDFGAYANPHWAGNAEKARAMIKPYQQVGKFKTFESNTELFPNIQTIACPGHTPGHTAYLVQSKGSNVLFVGDTIHCAEVQFPHPTFTIQYDVKPQQAMQARIKLFTDAADKGYIIAGPHISFPGLGHLSQQGEGFRWVSVQYQYDVKTSTK
jgi:glyoxylase-like metal-dependent hydrolase (beta-lactamase superfamily II)